MKEWPLEENIKAILECNFSIAKDELIESATRRIMEQISSQTPQFEDIKVEIQNTILLQTYQRGQINILEKIKLEINQIDTHRFNRTEVLKILDKCIEEIE